METEKNKFYVDLVERLDYALEHLEQEVTERAITPIKDVREALDKLSQQPKLKGNVQQFMDITTDMTKTYEAKNHDYGNSFDQSLYKFGLIASIVRMNDKMNRLETLASKKAEVKDESIEDTLLDLANYSIMTVMWLRNSRCIDGKPQNL